MTGANIPPLAVAERLLKTHWPAFTAVDLAACFEEKHGLYPVRHVELGDVTPIERASGVIGIHEQSAVSLLLAFSHARRVPPIVVRATVAPTRFQLCDGYHRFYLALAAGCTRIPAAVKPRQESAA